MCGIAGIYTARGKAVQFSEILAQLKTIAHRGPDQEAIYCSPDHLCGLGIRRLSIIDLQGGDQPLRSRDGSLQVVYNGETYNHRSLRIELEQLGHQPMSHNDGEVILHGYKAWGIRGMLNRLRGMFAFALWDEQKKRLLLARDRFGIKPLYYTQQENRLFFGSEIKAILACPEVPRRINLSALEMIFQVGFVPGPATIFEGIYHLPAAHFLVAQEGQIQVQRFWNLEYQEQDPRSEAEVVEQFLALLQESVQMRLMSEVPLGALLSGGLDSGTIVTLIQAAHSAHLKTISLGFEASDYDETVPARYLAHHLGTEHQPITFASADFDDYPTVMHHLETPQCSATAVPIYHLYRACRKAGLTVVLTGEGADELFGGYYWHQGDVMVRYLLWLPTILRRLLTTVSFVPMSEGARRVLRRGSRKTALRYQDWLAITTPPSEKFDLFSPEVRAELSKPHSSSLSEDWIAHVESLKTSHPFHQMLGLEAQTRLVDFINLEVDKMSMAHSIEARVPFLDHKIWEFCATLPADYKLRGRTEKYLLRQAMKKWLPEIIRTRKKKGLAAPYAYWLQSSRLPEWAETAISPSTLKKIGLFDVKGVEQIRQTHQQTENSRLGPLLMGILSTQIWADHFLTE